MTKWIKRLQQSIHRDQHMKKMAKKRRFIPMKLYIELKRKGKCMKCKRKRTAGQLEIHHIIPVKEGGESIRENLVSVCFDCHEILDKENGTWQEGNKERKNRAKRINYLKRKNRII